MSRHDSELFVLLVNDVYGESASHLLEILLCFGRLSIPGLKQHTSLSFRLIEHGLAVLIRHQLALWYSTDSKVTIYEANIETAYNLVRIGKYVRMVEERFKNPSATTVSNSATIVSKVLTIGHARHGDIVSQALNAKDQSNGTQSGSIDHGPEAMQKALRQLMDYGLLSPMNESHLRSKSDNRVEAEKVVPPIEHYKAKTKKESEAQWEGAVQKQVEEWKHSSKNNFLSESGKKGKKRQLEDPRDLRSGKRQRSSSPQRRNHTIQQASGIASLSGQPDSADDNIVLRINHEEFTVMMRHDCLTELAKHTICKSTAKVYSHVLREMEDRIRECRNPRKPDEESDEEPDFSSLPQVSTDDLFDTIADSKQLADSLGHIGPPRPGSVEEDHPKKRRKKEAESEDEAMVDGEASPDEEEEASGSEDDNSIASSNTTGNISEASEDDSNDGPKDPNRKVMRDHLLLLARHPYSFLHHVPATPGFPERWTVHFPPLIKHLRHHTLMQTITSRHGVHAARIVRILAEKGMVDEKNLWTLSFINQKLMRSHISALYRAGVIGLQEVPRDNGRNVQRTMYLWFFDEKGYGAKILHETYKSMSRCLQRAKVEGEKVKGTAEKASRTDVVGKEEEFLSKAEMEALEKWREVETKIYREVARLDDLVAILRDY